MRPARENRDRVVSPGGAQVCAPLRFLRRKITHDKVIPTMSARLRCSLAFALLSVATTAYARDVQLPLRVDNAFLLRLVQQQMFTGANGEADVWSDEAGCSRILLREPEVGSAAALVRVSSRFDAKLGAGLGNWCVGVTEWHGRVDVLLQPVVHPTIPIVEFRVVDSYIFNEGGEKTLTGTVWDWFKARVHPRMESVRVDLYGPVTELKLFLPLVLTVPDAELGRSMIDSLRIAAVTPTPDGLRVDVRMDVPEVAPASSTPQPVPTLTTEEVRRWQETIDSWDGFVTFLVKRAGRDVQTIELQRALGEILIEARYDLVEALRPSHAGEPDPVRPLFLRSWKRLAPLLREASLGVPGEEAVRYLSLVTAGDALTALDGLGPGFGLQISSDGLRRLARMVEPLAADPTARSEEVDPELRSVLGFGQPLPVPPLAPTPTPVAEEATPVGGTDEDGEGVAPDEAPSPTSEPVIDEELLDEAPEPVLPDPLSFLFGSPAYAAEIAAEDTERLDYWVPNRDELDAYLKLMRTVLRGAARDTSSAKNLPPDLDRLFGDLVLATAWKETCWRQFVRSGKNVVTLRSSAGALGMMQVNPRVWRGLYDIEALAANVRYNARAGTEILHHYLIDYALKKKEHEQPGGRDNLARATYSAYNAGPGRLRRYRTGSGHAIDRKFWDMYRKVQAGNELAVASCYGA